MELSFESHANHNAISFLQLHSSFKQHLAIVKFNRPAPSPPINCRGTKNCNLGFRTKSSGLAKCAPTCRCAITIVTALLGRLLSIVSPVQGAGDLNSGAIFDCRRVWPRFYRVFCSMEGLTRGGAGTSGACSVWVWVRVLGAAACSRLVTRRASVHRCSCSSLRATNLTLLGGFVSYGGIVWARDCQPVFTSCTFLNSSSQLGGAVLCDGGCRSAFVLHN